MMDLRKAAYVMAMAILQSDLYERADGELKAAVDRGVNEFNHYYWEEDETRPPDFNDEKLITRTVPSRREEQERMDRVMRELK